MLGTARGMVCWLVIIVMLAATALPAYADIGLRPGIMGEDDRLPLEATDPPWTAIGQVNIGRYRARQSCTGTLIAPRVVLTAAHCVVDAATKKPFAPKHIHFAAGVLRDTDLGRSVARCVKLPEGFGYVGPHRVLPDLAVQKVPFEHFIEGLAVIVLADDLLAAGLAPVVRREVFERGLDLIHASYPTDRRYRLTADASCTAFGREAGVWQTDCDMHAASVGGPVLVQDEGEMKVAAVMVGWIPNTATLAVPVARWPELPIGPDCSR